MSGDSELLIGDLLRDIKSSCIASETRICDLALLNGSTMDSGVENVFYGRVGVGRWV